MPVARLRGALILLVAAAAAGQEGPILAPHVPYVATTPEVAAAMLTLAKVQPSDVVYDLGCGDGRIVILAAQKYGARGVGIDIDPDRIREANENARRAGLTGKVRFIQADVFYADVREATVVTMFLLPSINVKLRPRLLRQLRPGTRVVTHSFDIGDWAPDRRIEQDGVPVYLWTVPETAPSPGRVVMEDGAPPPLAAAIERVCGEKSRFEGYTDARGAFSIALTRDERATPDCRVRAVLAGYRSETLPLQAEIGTLHLKRTGRAAGGLVSATTANAPAAAKEAFERGRQALERAARDEAETAFASAVEIYPQFAMAWFELGTLLESRGGGDEARAAYQEAIEADPQYISPYLGLTQLAVHRNQWREVAAYTATVLRLDPESFPDAWLYHAVGSMTLRNYDDAERSAREAMRLDTAGQFPRAEYVLGQTLAVKGDIAGARKHLTHYLEADPKAPDAALIRQQLSGWKDSGTAQAPATERRER
jgi:tetratricopeptide (TPR) repeat protein